MWAVRLPEHRLPTRHDVFVRITSDLPSPATTLPLIESTVVRRWWVYQKRRAKRGISESRGLRDRVSCLSPQ
jgi:hypothetical protein